MPHGERRTAAVTSPAHGPSHRLEVEVRAERVEEVAAALWARGANGVWERPGALVAWFAPESATPDTALETSPDVLPAAPTFDDVAGVPELAPERQRWSIEPDRDWQAEWKRTIRPVRAGRVMIVPTWLADRHEPAEAELTLVLDPGRAFGSGHHATTVLCLELLDAVETESGFSGRTVADIGCGTGVLAIAAAAWGATVTAVDIDPDAVVVTRENAARNQVSLDAAVGTTDVLRGPSDVVVANLVTDVIVDLAAELVAVTRTTLVVSGIARERRERALDALHACGARPVEVRERDGWVAVRLETGADEGDDT